MRRFIFVYALLLSATLPVIAQRPGGPPGLPSGGLRLVDATGAVVGEVFVPTAGPRVLVVRELPDGTFTKVFASKDALFPFSVTPAYYTSADCSGTPLYSSPDHDAELIRTALQAPDGSLGVWQSPGAVVTINSYSLYGTNACYSPDQPVTALFSTITNAIGVSQFVPPLRVVK